MPWSDNTLATGDPASPSPAEAATKERLKPGLLIINADDWGGWRSATDAAHACFNKGRITSVSAMVFMGDSERAASLANDSGIDVGLHLNLNQSFTGKHCPARIIQAQERTRRFLKRNKYALIAYHPFLKKHFEYAYQSQFEEFCRLYGRPPSHIDGHQHMHLCSNMLFANLIPKGTKIRRSFSFWPGEKGRLNRLYRALVDRRLTHRYVTTDYMFALSQCLGQRMTRVTDLAAHKTIELMTHPEKKPEYDWLMSEAFIAALGHFRAGTFSMLSKSNRTLEQALPA